MNESQIDLSIIIVNWNTRDLLHQSLRAVYDTTHDISFEVVVVDNASTDGSQEMVRREFPNVQLLVNSENLGFAKANNQAIQHSKGRHILLLNSDTFVREYTVKKAVAFLDMHPQVGMVGCKLLYEDGRLQPSCSSFPTLFTEFCIVIGLDKLFPRSSLFAKYRMTYWDFDDVREVDVIMGAFMLVRASAIDKVGPMDENYFMYSEEVDWCYRFKKQGWKIYFFPYVEAVHLWGGSIQHVRTRMLIQMYRSRVHFFRKHYGRGSASLLKLFLAFGCLLRVGPGVLYYRVSGNVQSRQKYQSFWQLLQTLPSL